MHLHVCLFLLLSEKPHGHEHDCKILFTIYYN